MVDNLVYQGQRLRIEYAVRLSGAMPAKEFYEGLPRKERAKLFDLFTRLGDRGWISNDQQFKKLEGDIWEFKKGQSRTLCFFGPGGAVVLTHGFPKKTPRTPRVQIERANRIRGEHLSRRREDA